MEWGVYFDLLVWLCFDLLLWLFKSTTNWSAIDSSLFLFVWICTTTKTLICPGWETPCCPGFPTGNASSGQKGVLFCPGSGNRDKRCSQRPRGWRTLLSRLVVPFFMFSFSQFFFYFNYTFAFQLNLCIGIQYVWSPLIYIYNYLYNICPR